MNTKRLAQNYETLLPEERVALVSKAKARNDDVEIGRLLNSAPTLQYQLPNFFGVADTFSLMSLIQLSELLDLAMYYHRCIGWVECWAIDDNQELSDQMYQTAQVFGYLFITQLDAWRQFLDNHQMDHNEFWRGLSGDTSIVQTEKSVRGMVISKTEVESILQQKDSCAQAYSVEDYLAVLERSYAEAVAKWK